ncbi:S24 family peptidase [Shewanella algae]|uniref:S24 family peptidase n=1 Tax=Shewanella algae TaxID=38313 RepID=UPI001AAC4AE0|nr:helix-turn-helix transcriptional regulator [Shewanella algae]MBO2684963.1 helix-turn-helix transcriptional regulator [Shewanella algae]
MKTLGERLKAYRKSSKLTQAELGKRVGVSGATISQWESGDTSPKGENLHKLARALSTSADLLLFGKEKSTKSDSNARYVGQIEPWDSSTPLDEDEVEVPFYTEVELAAGCGSFAISENHGPKLRFSKNTLRRHGVDPINVVCVKVNGTSMEPVLPTGSTVGIDTQSTKVQDGKMYAINHDGMLRIKLLYRLPGSGLRLRSYNQEEYPDEVYQLDQTKGIIIIGKVFWYSVLI